MANKSNLHFKLKNRVLFECTCKGFISPQKAKPGYSRVGMTIELLDKHVISTKSNSSFSLRLVLTAQGIKEDEGAKENNANEKIAFNVTYSVIGFFDILHEAESIDFSKYPDLLLPAIDVLYPLAASEINDLLYKMGYSFAKLSLSVPMSNVIKAEVIKNTPMPKKSPRAVKKEEAHTSKP